MHALLRYLYTLDCEQILDSGDHIFVDIERDLDIFVVADKYDAPVLRAFMVSKLVLFYEADKSPLHDRNWRSLQSQEAFGRVLRKLYNLDMDTTPIKRAVVDFIVRWEKKVMQWTDVLVAVEEDARISNDIIQALLRSRRQILDTATELDYEVEKLKAEVEVLQEDRDIFERDNEDLASRLYAEDNWYGHYEWANRDPDDSYW